MITADQIKRLREVLDLGLTYREAAGAIGVSVDVVTALEYYSVGLTYEEIATRASNINPNIRMTRDQIQTIMFPG